MRTIAKVVPWACGGVGFLVGVLLAFVVLEVWLGMRNGGGTKLSVVIALAPAILAYDLSSRVVGRLVPPPAEA